MLAKKVLQSGDAALSYLLDKTHDFSCLELLQKCALAYMIDIDKQFFSFAVAGSYQ